MADIERLCMKLALPYDPTRLPNFKSEFRPKNELSVSDFYDQECIDIVVSSFHFELEKFGYAAPKI